jgi:ATP-binding cassette subfamily B protein
MERRMQPLAMCRPAVALMEQSIRSMRWRDFYRALLLDVRAAKEIRLFGLGELLFGRMLGRAPA